MTIKEEGKSGQACPCRSQEIGLAARNKDVEEQKMFMDVKRKEKVHRRRCKEKRT